MNRNQPLTDAELGDLAEHMKYNPGLYGENVHRLMATAQAEQTARKMAVKVFQDLADQLAAGEASDGHHTHRELYRYRMLYNAYAALGMYAAGYTVFRSWKHHDGEDCFGGGWFIVVMDLPTGQVSNHYQAEHWDLFHEIPELKTAPEWDGHTPEEAAQRLQNALAGMRPDFLDLKFDSERVKGVEVDLSWTLSELGHEHWQDCDLTAEGCYLCGGYLDLKGKYGNA